MFARRWSTFVLGTGLVFACIACESDASPVSLTLDPDTEFSGVADSGAAPVDAAADAGRVQDGGSDEDGAVLPPDAGAAGGGFRLLLVNLETAALDHPTYPRYVRLRAYEERLAERINLLRPQMVVLLHVLPPEVCGAVAEMDPTRPCFEAEGRAQQVQRLVGDAYAVVCDALAETVCVAVLPSFGTVEGVAAGALSTEASMTENLPAPPCDYDGGNCTDESCDQTSAVMAVDLVTPRGPLRVVAIDANGSGVSADGMFYLGTRCRVSQAQQAFGLAGEGSTLLVGDWAFEPGQMFQDRETAVWEQNVGEALRFGDHDARGAGGAREPTSENPPKALAHVVSDFAVGACTVMRTPPLDDGFVFEPPEEATGRIAQFAVRCELEWGP